MWERDCSLSLRKTFPSLFILRLMKILEVLFYNHIRWLRLVKSNPHGIIASAFFILGMTIVIPVCVLMEACTMLRAEGHHTTFIYITVIVVFGVLYFAVLHNGKAEKIMQTQPKLFGSDGLSILITVAIFLLAIGAVLWWSFQAALIKNFGG